MTQTIGIIGSGLVGKAVARLAIAAGYKVVISNSRGADSIKDLIEELGPLASAGTTEEAIAAGDIVTLSIPIAASEQLPADKFAGKVVLDQTNYYPAFGNNDVLDKAEVTSSELIQRRLPGAKVVKGFHNLSWLHMKANATPKGSANRTTLPIAGDDVGAKQAVTEFFDKIGFDTIDAGSLADSWRIEPSTPIYFWAYAPKVDLQATGPEAERAYTQPGTPVSREVAQRLIDEATSQINASALLDGRLDVAFMPGDPQLPGCRAERLWDETIFLAVPAFHQTASLNAVSWEDVSHETFLVKADATRSEIEDYLRRHLCVSGLSPKISVQHIGCENLLSIVAQGFGITLATNSIVGIAYPGVRFVPIAGGKERFSFSAVWSATNQNPALKFLIDMSIERRMKTKR